MGDGLLGGTHGEITPAEYVPIHPDSIWNECHAQIICYE
jgi:hypothetical protein